MVNEEIVTANSGGTGIKMTAQRGGTPMKNVTAEGCGMANVNKVATNSGSNDTLG